MKKILVLSDTHGDSAALRRCLNQEQDADALIFLGDGVREVDGALAHLRRRLPAYIVSGNCDYGSYYPAEGLAAFEGVLVFYAHGHLYGVNASPLGLCRTAMARGADVALFGHTHRPLTMETPGFPSVYNPGSASRPRGPEGPTYGVLLLGRSFAPHFCIRPVPPLPRTAHGLP